MLIVGWSIGSFEERWLKYQLREEPPSLFKLLRPMALNPAFLYILPAATTGLDSGG